MEYYWSLSIYNAILKRVKSLSLDDRVGPDRPFPTSLTLLGRMIKFSRFNSPLHRFWLSCVRGYDVRKWRSAELHVRIRSDRFENAAGGEDVKHRSLADAFRGKTIRLW